MILRKQSFLTIKVTQSQRQTRTELTLKPSIPIFFSLLFFVFVMAPYHECIVHGPYGPHRPRPTPIWSMRSTPADSSVNNDSKTPLGLADGTTTEALLSLVDMPDEDDTPIDEVMEEYGDNETNFNGDVHDDRVYISKINPEERNKVTEPTNEKQVILIRATTVIPNVTIIDFNENKHTEALPQTKLPPTPEEELDQMLESLDNLLSNESAVVTVANVTDTFDQLDVLLETEDLEFPSSMLQALDTLGARADLNGSQSVSTIGHNVGVVMADSAPAHPVRGLRITKGFTDDALEIFHDMDPASLFSAESEAVVNLPASLADSYRRVSFVVFRSDRAFVRHDRDEQYIVNSKVISVNAENFTKMNEGEVIDIHLKPSIYKPARNLSRACAYWHFAGNGTGYWSQEGCTFIRAPTGQLDTCRCTHLTHFAEVLVPKAVFSEANEQALEIISLTGCFLSLFGLFVIGLTAILFRSWRNDFNNKIWLQLTLALLINVTCFLIIVFSKFEDYSMFCFFVGLLLHYSVLASFCWMLVAAVISYRKLVLIFVRDPSRKLLKASAFSWFFPLAVVTILVAIAPESYVRRFDKMTPNGAFCYPSGLGLWLTVYAPIAIIVVLNWMFFALIIRSVFAKRTIQKHGDSSEFLRRASVTCLLVFLFGLPWIFGLFAYNIVAAYLFTLTTSYQGFVLFIFFVLVNTKTRQMWLKKLRIHKKSKAPVSSSFLSNRSEPVKIESEMAFLGANSTRTNVTSLMNSSVDGRAIQNNVSTDSALIEDSHSDNRNDSDGSFITANSFGNIREEVTDEDRSNLYESCLDGMVELEADSDAKIQSELATDARSVLDDSNGIPVSNRESNAETKSNKGREINSSLSQGNTEFIDPVIDPAIMIYEVPTQSASLVS